MTQKPPKRNPAPIGSSTPSQRHSDKRPIVLVEGAASAATVSLLLGDRYEVVAAAPNALREYIQADWSWLAGREVVIWRDTEPDPASPVVRADQARDPLADFVIGALALAGVLILLSWLWWASHGGKWVAPW